MHDSHDLEVALRSTIPIILIDTHEEERILEMLKRICANGNLPLIRWTVTDGFVSYSDQFLITSTYSDPLQMLSYLRGELRTGVFLLLDIHPYLTDPARLRLFKEIAQGFTATRSTLVLVGHNINLPPELRAHAITFTPSVPNLEQLREVVNGVAAEWGRLNPGKKVKAERNSLDRLVQNLQGLTATDAKRLARQAIYNDGAITENDIEEVMRVRYELLEHTGALTFEHDVQTFDQIAGFKNLKEWIEHRRGAFESKINVFKLLPPKGILLLGVQGCGKSAAARAVAGSLNIPLLRFDFGSVYNKYIGESERILRESLRAAEALSPCVLWMDEIEKGIGSDSHDGGTSRRVFGQLLTWMAEKKAPVFVVATANDIESLPPELIRKGRFDEIFFVDLPTQDDRESIFRIHLARRSLKSESYNIAELGARSAGFSGAEIEQAIIASLYRALSERVMLTDVHILDEITKTRPLSVVMGEKIQRLQEWARDRTVLA